MLPNAFSVYASNGYGADLLPIIPPDAKLSDKAGENVAASRGKIPGKSTHAGWVGFAKWAAHTASEADLARWASWGAGVGLQARRFPAFDIDVSHGETAELLHSLVVNIVGDSPVRTGRPPRRLLPYQTSYEITKRRFAFRLPGDDTVHAIELLGAGQQYVIDGVHPGTLQPYTWSAPLPPADFLHELTPDLVERIFAEVAAAVALLGGEPVTKHQGGARSAGVAAGGLLAPSIEAVKAALDAVPNDVDYDTWVKIGVAVKAATGASEDGRELWCTWSDQYTDSQGDADSKWDSFRPPFKIGWDFLSRWAVREGGFNAASHEFDAVEETEKPAPDFSDGDALAKLHQRFVWVHRDQVAYDTETREVLDRTQFNVRNNHVGDPSSTKACAWAQWLRDPVNLRQVQRLTYRPGDGPYTNELDGVCANVWTPSRLAPDMSATADDVAPWLEHAAFMYPNDRERNILLDWLAFLLQRPGEKPQWSVLMGSSKQGIGKDLMLSPILLALGMHNVEQITAEQVVGRFTSWAENRRLIVVQEMEQFGTRATADKLKPFQSTKPDMFAIEKKGVDVYSIPNIFAMLFMTNNENAMQLSDDDRRTLVLWSTAEPRTNGYYDSLADWVNSGGAEKVAGYLLGRDLTKFLQMHRAPMTDQKIVMTELSRSPLEEYLREGIASCTGMFAADLVAAVDLLHGLPPEINKRYVTASRLGAQLRAAGAVEIGRPRRVTKEGMQQVRLYALRNADTYRAMGATELLKAYDEMRELTDPFKTEVAA